MNTIRKILSKVTRRLIVQQITLCNGLDRLLPHDIRIDAKEYFRNYYLQRLITEHARIYDIGGGRNPVISMHLKGSKSLSVIGLDISAEELTKAPHGMYDFKIAADITNFEGAGDGDFVVSKAMLEHVKDTNSAFRSIHTILKPGGLGLIFVPCRNAIFARINTIIPESWKRRILFLVYPSARNYQGWPAYYDHCTPSGFRVLAEANGFEVVDLKAFYFSVYFQFFLPLYLVWRLWVLLARALMDDDAAETFCICVRKKPLAENAGHSLSAVA